MTATDMRITPARRRALARAGLVEQDPVVDPDMTVWRLTDTGRQLATDLGLDLKAAG
jgi:hypothetical protein